MQNVQTDNRRYIIKGAKKELTNQEVKQEMPLIERIGIDKSTISGFSLLSIDNKKFREQAKSDKGKMWYTLNDQSCIELTDGRKIGEIAIKAKDVGEFHVKYKKNNVTGSGRIVANLKLLTHDNGNNFQNMTCKEYRSRIADVFETLEVKYGVRCDFTYDKLIVKNIEFNATFWLKHPYDTYRWCLLLMERILPPRYAVGSRENKRIKTGAFDSHYVRDFANKTYADYLKDKEQMPLSKKETIFCSGNKSTEVKIYHKNMQLIEVEAISPDYAENRDAMRIEYKIKDSRILKSKKNFKSDKVKDLTDKKIAKFYKSLFKRDFIRQYNGWKTWNHRELMSKIEEHRKKNDKWTSYFLREVRKYSEIHNGTPLLFDIEDVRSALKEIEKNSQKGNKKYRQFKKNLEFESDLVGNNDRMQEIFSKVMEM